jgi:adenine-specific DNA-methyltransferase
MGKKPISSFTAQLTLTDSQAAHQVAERYRPDASATLFLGDRLDLIRQIPPESARLIVTSPPYNIGKEYEQCHSLDEYLEGQRQTIAACYDILAPDGSLCWQVGNHIVGPAEILPLDIPIHAICAKLGLKLRNRIVWHFEHGLHCTKRFSGRYETLMWFTKTDHYVFNLDAVRVPQKYPGKKNYKGSKAGTYSCNPLGKNPSDVWIIPNVKSNHCEKTVHPCQFPVELIERLVLALTNPGDLVVDPYIGVASTVCAAVLRGRRGAGADIEPEYLRIGRERVLLALQGALRTRPMGRPVYDASQSRLSIRPKDLDDAREKSLFA